MTLVSEIIQQAYRETNIIPLGAEPNNDQLEEGLARLNAIVQSAVGNEIAEPGFREITIGGDFDQSELVTSYIPDNSRLILNLDGAIEVGLCPTPYEGQRVSIADVLGNVATFNVVIVGNGRSIEGAESVTLDEDGIARQWLYRADTGNWVRITPLDTTDEMPFPEEFDDYFVAAVALRLSPRYGQTLPSETIEILRRSRSQLRSRYRNRHYIPLPDPGLLRREEYIRAPDSESYFDLGRWTWLF